MKLDDEIEDQIEEFMELLEVSPSEEKLSLRS
jgi:hypothetical protein